MLITYTPSDGEKQSWEFDPLKVLDDAAEDIEYHYRGTYDEFHVGVLKGATRARRVLLWHLQRQTHPSLQFADLPRFERRQLEVELNRVELKAMREQAEKAKLAPADREMALALIDAELDSLGDEPEPAEDGGAKGKALPSGGTTTRSKSPSTSASRRTSSGG